MGFFKEGWCTTILRSFSVYSQNLSIWLRGLCPIEAHLVIPHDARFRRQHLHTAQCEGRTTFRQVSSHPRQDPDFHRKDLNEVVEREIIPLPEDPSCLVSVSRSQIKSQVAEIMKMSRVSHSRRNGIFIVLAGRRTRFRPRWSRSHVGGDL